MKSRSALNPAWEQPARSSDPFDLICSMEGNHDALVTFAKTLTILPDGCDLGDGAEVVRQLAAEMWMHGEQLEGKRGLLFHALRPSKDGVINADRAAPTA